MRRFWMNGKLGFLKNRMVGESGVRCQVSVVGPARPGKALPGPRPLTTDLLAEGDGAAALDHDVVEDDARDDDRGEERCQDAGHERHGEALDGPDPERVQDDADEE